MEKMFAKYLGFHAFKEFVSSTDSWGTAISTKCIRSPVEKRKTNDVNSQAKAHTARWGRKRHVIMKKRFCGTF